MNIDLTGKCALVCGSTQGIGRAAAIELAKLGSSVILLARNEEKLRQVAKELPLVADGQRHGYRVADFSDPETVRTAAQQIVGKQTIHILVNNTGGPPAGSALEAQPEAYVQAFSSHLICNQLLVQAVVPGMKQEGYGRIINIISTSVKIPIRGLGVSNTVRGAVASWAKTLSMELGSFGITVNNVLPGATQTGRLDRLIRDMAARSGRTEDDVRSDMVKEIPAGRIGKPEEVAVAIAFLASPSAAYINGINLPVDGGRTGSL